MREYAGRDESGDPEGRQAEFKCMSAASRPDQARGGKRPSGGEKVGRCREAEAVAVAVAVAVAAAVLELKRCEKEREIGGDKAVPETIEA